MVLKIRDDEGNVKKVYETNALIIKWKNVKEFLNLVDINEIDNDEKIGRMAISLAQDGKIDNFLKQTFRGITQEEIDELDIFQDLVPAMKEMITFIKDQIKGLPKSKN